MATNNASPMPIDRSRFAINRCVAPGLAFVEFLKFARDAGVLKVELRNDLAANHPIDGLDVGEAARLLEDHEIEVISINAVQRFNLPSARREAPGRDRSSSRHRGGHPLSLDRLLPELRTGGIAQSEPALGGHGRRAQRLWSEVQGGRRLRLSRGRSVTSIRRCRG